MKMLLAFLVLTAVVLCAYVLRRGAGAGGYRRRFENAYRRDDRESVPVPGVMFITGPGDAGTHHHHATGHDCGFSTDGGSAGCDGGS